jgi:hypothetical protein
MRKTVADKFGVLPYHIMNNVALQSIQAKRPTSIPDLAILPGMGDVRAKKYGADILACVQAVLRCDGLDAADFADFDAMLEEDAAAGTRGAAPGAGAARPITLDSDGEEEDDIFSAPPASQKRRRGVFERKSSPNL